MIYDVTFTLSPAFPVWPGDPAVRLEQIASMEAGDEANVSALAMSVHVGTHVDAPHHFLNDGRTVENLPLEALIGPCRLVTLPETLDAVSAAALEAANIPPDTERLLLRTRNAALWRESPQRFRRDFVAITADGAEWLVARGLRLVGVDYLSVAPFTAPVPTHRILLGAGVVVLEGLNLADVPDGDYRLYCLPLKLRGADGAPARVILEG